MICFPSGLGFAFPATSAPPAVGALDVEILFDEPLAYYRLDEAPGATIYLDSSGNALDLGTIEPIVTSGGTGLSDPGTSTEFNGTAYIASGNNEFGALMAAQFDGDKAFTIAMMVKPAMTSDRVVFHVGNASVAGSQGFFVQLMADGRARLQFLVDGVGYKNVDTAPGAISVGSTYILHFRREVGGLSTIWIDGVESTGGGASLTGSVAMDATSSSGGSRVMIGALNQAAPADFYGGEVQHVALFASAVSGARIATHAAAVVTPAAAGFGAHRYWSLYITAVDSGSTCSIGEVEMREFMGTEDLCVGGTASASASDPAYPPAGAFDNLNNTRWASAVLQPSRLIYDFGSPVTIGELRIRAPNSGNYASSQMLKDFALEYSDDGIAWTQAGNPVVGESPMAVEELRTYHFLPIVSGEDEYFQFVSSYLPMTTDFADAISGNTWTATGATVSGGVGNFDGVNDIVRLAAGLAFAYGRSDYTAEGFLDEDSSAGTQCFLDTRSASTQGIGLYNRGAFAGGVALSNNDTGLIGGSSDLFSSVSGQHWALVRQRGLTRFYLGGSQKFTVTDERLLAGAAVTYGDNYLGPASQPSGSKSTHLRSTRRFCRYPNGVTFTPPSGPFPLLGGTPLPPGVGPGAHRYWRLFINSAVDTTYNGMTELELFDTDFVLVSGYNSGTTGSISSSGSINAGNIDYQAFDRNLVNQGWLSAVAGNQWIRQDFQFAATIGRPVEIRKIGIYGSWNVPDASPKDFKLQWSDDDSAWTDALVVTGETGWAARELREFLVF